MATIVTKNSSTATSVPSSSDLVEGELAVNTADKRLFTENNSATVVELGINPSSLTTGVLTATSVTTTGLLTAGGLAYPTADGSPSTVLATNGSGTLDFISVSGAYDLATQAEAEAGTVTTGKIFSPLRVKQAIDALAETTGADIASATAVDLTAATGNTVVITGTVTSTSLTMNAGQQMILLPSGAWPLTYHATTMNIMGGVSYTCAAGDRIYAVKDLAGVIRVSVFKQDGTAVVTGSVAVGSITGLATGVATFLATSSSANLASAVTDETGSGSLVFATSPTLVTPALGTPSSGTLTNATGLPPAGVTGTAAILGANTFTALQTQSAGADIASATTVDLTAATGNTVIITGTTTTTAFTMTKGQQMVLIAAAAWPLTFHATTMNINGGVSYTCAAGDRLYVVKDDDDVIRVSVNKQDGTAVVASAAGVREFTATGTIADGIIVTLESDGTVKATTQSVSAPSLGSPTVFESAVTYYESVTFDSNSNKVVVAYRDAGNSNYGTAVVGTVSGTSISFGTPVVFNSGESNYISATFDSNENKVVIGYKDVPNSSSGVGIVGTVSGTSISFGTEVTFSANATDYISATFDSNSNKVVFAYKHTDNSGHGTAIVGTVSGTAISYGTAVVFEAANTAYEVATFDSNSNKVVIVYSDAENNDYGTGIVGTVSGTAISFGTAVVFESGITETIGATFDSNSNKVVIAYRDADNSDYGTAIVGTVSGTAISYGTAVVFESANSGYNVATFDSAQNKVVIAYKDLGNSSYGTLILGTVSGTAISFGSPVVFESAESNYISSTFDTSATKTVIAYRDDGNSDYGTAVVYGSDVTTDVDNEIGIAAEAGTDGNPLDVTILGGVNASQSGLTIADEYWAAADGTLSSSDTGYPKMGVALSATELLIRGSS